MHPREKESAFWPNAVEACSNNIMCFSSSSVNKFSGMVFVVNAFLSISARKLYVLALGRRSTTESLRKGLYGWVQISRPSSQQ